MRELPHGFSARTAAALVACLVAFAMVAASPASAKSYHAGETCYITLQNTYEAAGFQCVPIFVSYGGGVGEWVDVLKPYSGGHAGKPHGHHAKKHHKHHAKKHHRHHVKKHHKHHSKGAGTNREV